MDALTQTVIDETGLNEGAVRAAGQAFVDTVENPRRETASADEAEIARLRSKSEEYKTHEAEWRFFLRAYEGGPDYVGEDTLFRHSRETEEDFRNRVKRAHYQNYCQPLVDFVPEYIFSQDVERESPKDLAAQFEAIKADADKAGTALNTFMQTVGEDMRIFGHVFIQCDKLPLPAALQGQEISVQQEQDLGLDLPYFIVVRPLEVLDWRTDSRGNLLYLKRVETTVLEQGDSYIDVERYTEWRKDRIRVSYIDVSNPKEPKLLRDKGAAESKANPWKVIPFIPAFYKRKKSNKEVGQSFLQDIAYQNRAVFNQTSLIDEFLARQCFNILAVPAKSNIPFKEQVDGTVGVGNVWEIPVEATIKPEYVTPPIDPAEFIQTERTNIIREMYRQAAQDVLSELMSPGRNSGDSARQQFSRTIPVINKTADALQYTERRMMTLWAKMQDKKWDGKISYKDDYSVTNLLDLLIQLSMIFNDLKLFSPTFIKAEWKRVVREFDGKLDQKTIDDIIAEIEKLTDDEIKSLLGTVTEPTAMGIDANGNPVATATGRVPKLANLVQGKKQEQFGTDKRIGAATGSKATTKETLPDSNKRATTGSKR